MPDVIPVRCSMLRGGTSRGVFFMEDALPADREIRSRILLDVFGSPDVRQIDGLGGATSQTSKAAIIGPPTRSDADVDYTFAQVSVTDALVDWGGNCGNISSAVGPFAIDHGLVRARDPLTTVRIHNTNTGKLIVAQVPVEDGRAARDGDYAISGVPGTGARVGLEFIEPGGSVTGRLLPTGRAVDAIELPDGRVIEASIVDAGNPVVFLRASDLGASGTELPPELDARTDLTATLEAVRAIAAELLGIVAHRSEAATRSPGLPKVGYVAPPAAYRTSGGALLDAESADLSGRLMSMRTAHRSYMVTGAIATAAAAQVPGTVVHEATRPHAERPRPDTIRIAHPYGVMDVNVRSTDGPDGPFIDGIEVGRTARHILDGEVWVRRSAFEAPTDGRSVAATGALVAD